jgi:NAD(P)-dependent dehydrogenase (short-subunit alcohol dehydrogenase family)
MAPVALGDAVVLITGAARGIGLATALEFAARGAKVALGDIDGAAARAAAAQVASGAAGFELDVRSRESFTAFVQSAEAELGPTDVLVNNAGIMPLGPFLGEDDDTSRRTIEINLWGPIIGMRLVAPGMVERGSGHVVNVASMMGKAHVQGAAVYGASKYALVGLDAAVRDELAGTGVSITTVLPSAVRTGLISGISIPRALPVVEPEEVARAIVESCRGRPAQVHVPRWLAAYDPVTAVVPDRVIGAVRRLLGDDAALKADAEARADYEARARADERR